MFFQFTYANGRTRNFDNLDAFCAALARKRTADAVIWMYTRYGCSTFTSVDTADQARAVHAEFVGRTAALALDIRRPVLWSELRPEAMQAHMARRPKGHSRQEWAERLNDSSLDEMQTVNEQVAQIDPHTMEAHMSRRPQGCPRPEWRRRIIAEPAGGYDAYARLVINA